MRFWFQLNFFFISASFDILSSLSFPRNFSSGFSGWWKSSSLDIHRTIIKLDLMCEELRYQIINTSAVNEAVFCYYLKSAKIIIKKKKLALAIASNVEMHFLNSLEKDLGKHIWAAFGSPEFLNIHIFNWCKAVYSASSSTLRHLNFVRAIRWLRAASPILYS